MSAGTKIQIAQIMVEITFVRGTTFLGQRQIVQISVVFVRVSALTKTRTAQNMVGTTFVRETTFLGQAYIVQSFVASVIQQLQVRHV